LDGSCALQEEERKINCEYHIEKEASTFLDDDLDIGLDFGNNPNDSILLGLDSLMAADDADDVTNLFDFK
jgi:hypothetical protein